MPSPDWRDQLEDAVRVYIESVSYRNPLPLWNAHLGFPIDKVTEHARRRGEAYFAGLARSVPPLRLTLPHKPSVRRDWLVPSNTDQFLLQAATASFAEPLCAELEQSDHVFSYRYERGPDKLANFTDPLEAWVEFQEETLRRLESSLYILQLDLRDAFGSIDRKSFFSYLRPRGSESGTSLLRLLLQVWEPDGRGIPLVNDSLFYLGNCYLGRVDDLIENYAGNFIRFVDDYRIFAETREELERAHEQISSALPNIGFSLNPSKVKLGSAAEFLDAVRGVEKASSQNYYGVRVFLDVISPEQLVGLVDSALKHPERYMTVRFGRLVAAELRRVRDKKYGGRVYRSFVSLLNEDQALNDRVWKLLGELTDKPGEDWRLTWLLYLIEDLERTPAATGKLEQLVNGSSQLVRLWALRALGKCHVRPSLSSLDLPYVEEAAASCAEVTV